MKKLSFCLLAYLLGICINFNSYAATFPAKLTTPLITSGLYVGAILGAGNTNYSRSSFNNSKTGSNTENGVVHSSGFAIRGLVGYLFNQYFGVEAGYTHFDDTKGSDLNYSDGTRNKSGYIKQNAVDLMAKGILPVSRAISFYLKLGAAYVYSDVKVNGLFSTSHSGVKPAGALGVAFNATKHFVVDASYYRIQSSGSIKSADMFGIGFYWHFV
jgi:hypothetical protein